MNQRSAEAPAETYHRYLESGELGFQSCEGCEAAIFYPRVLCPACGGSALEWRTSSGRGVVYATTAVYPREDEPYNVCLVDLEEGFRMMSRVEGVAESAAEGVAAGEVEIGLPVTFETRTEDDGPVAVFVPGAKTEAG